jgi:hypothetical protein
MCQPSSLYIWIKQHTKYKVDYTTHNNFIQGKTSTIFPIILLIS